MLSAVEGKKKQVTFKKPENNLGIFQEKRCRV